MFGSHSFVHTQGGMLEIFIESPESHIYMAPTAAVSKPNLVLFLVTLSVYTV